MKKQNEKTFEEIQQENSHLGRLSHEEWLKTRAAVTHQCPPAGSNILPCCGKTPFEVPETDRMTEDPNLVTCNKVDHPNSASE